MLLLLQKHRYGFLTYLQATFFIARRGDNIYAFTRAVRSNFTEPSVTEMLTCRLLLLVMVSAADSALMSTS